ncbi:nfx1-type zinc finger-containing protein 1 [Colletotrichum chrysophilum]|uniref:Nfx1-type zinc finger-containing protein 1 n=1 Tax=Colletotrichum chrysophilum TaxID=1836956 RepID=A0AAD9AQ67_9PEZI|nr:nfx1-type zinc finger-containing protein 1 [Colletotrichum chrysophilum]
MKAEDIDDDSPSRLEWLRQKQEENEKNVHLDQLMTMVGLENVKAHFLAVKAIVKASKQTGDEHQKLRLHLVLHGNDGTGKKSIAQLYAQFLYSIGAVAEQTFARTSRYRLTSRDRQTSGSRHHFDDDEDCDRDDTDDDGDDDDYSEEPDSRSTPDSQKDPALSNTGIVNNAIGDAETSVVIISCREKALLDFIDKSEKALQELPVPLTLPDYSDDELRQLLVRMMQKRGFSISGGFEDGSLRALARRMAQERKSSQQRWSVFDYLQQELDEACKRRARRLQADYMRWFDNLTNSDSQSSGLSARQKDGEMDATEAPKVLDVIDKQNMVFMPQDLLGSEPKDARIHNASWKKLQTIIGLNKVKSEIGNTIDFSQTNYQRELLGVKPLKIGLNRLFLGPPGVGKTTVAALYGQILIDLGLLTGTKVMVRNPSDLIGRYPGQSEQMTQDILSQARGNVLIIDDAHMLYPGANGGGNKTDVYRTAVLDTIVANVFADPENRCIILVGYDYEMGQLFNNCNPGLQRRFPKETALHFDPAVSRQVISRMRINPKFGNAGDVENLLNQAKVRLNARIRSGLSHGQPAVEPADINPQWDRASQAEGNRAALFKDFVGFREIVEKFEGYQLLVDGMRLHDIDPKPHIPWAFIFKGPPGTGKTSTARKIGRLYYDMGLLSTDEVVTCSVTDIVGEYVGQTGPKVLNTLETGLGKVLFIDEAYRLATGTNGTSGSNFHMEAVGELVDAMTQPRYRNNMVIILAGYTREMECLLQTNPGLRSRFPEHITFEPMAPHACLQYLKNQLHKLRIGIVEGDDSSEIVHDLFESLSLTTGWASGRDVETLARRIISSVYMQQGKFGKKGAVGSLQVSTTDLVPILEEMWEERR